MTRVSMLAAPVRVKDTVKQLQGGLQVRRRGSIGRRSVQLQVLPLLFSGWFVVFAFGDCAMTGRTQGAVLADARAAPQGVAGH